MHIFRSNNTYLIKMNHMEDSYAGFNKFYFKKSEDITTKSKIHEILSHSGNI